MFYNGVKTKLVWMDDLEIVGVGQTLRQTGRLLAV